MRPILFLLILLPCVAGAQTLREAQDTFPRVRTARMAHEGGVRELFLRNQMTYPPAEIYLRVFKKEKQLELWARKAESGAFRRIKTYRICAMSGRLGPKREEADEQVPEGFYYLAGFNPTSHYHLSLRVSYPNFVDEVLGHKGRLGGDIFIHGGCDTIGCIPLTDAGIEELYLIVVDVLSTGAPAVPIHIFPMRLTDERYALLERAALLAQPSLAGFWRNLKEGYDFFERTHRPPFVASDLSGLYSFY